MWGGVCSFQLPELKSRKTNIPTLDKHSIETFLLNGAFQSNNQETWEDTYLMILNHNFSVSPSSYARENNGKRISKNACPGFNVTCPLLKQDITRTFNTRSASVQKRH
jgi:hypothetical protein